MRLEVRHFPQVGTVVAIANNGMGPYELRVHERACHAGAEAGYLCHMLGLERFDVVRWVDAPAAELERVEAPRAAEDGSRDLYVPMFVTVGTVEVPPRPEPEDAEAFDDALGARVEALLA
jgi:hypothetical protein